MPSSSAADLSIEILDGLDRIEPEAWDGVGDCLAGRRVINRDRAVVVSEVALIADVDAGDDTDGRIGRIARGDREEKE